jgi:hypothetical protein
VKEFGKIYSNSSFPNNTLLLISGSSLILATVYILQRKKAITKNMLVDSPKDEKKELINEENVKEGKQEVVDNEPKKIATYALVFLTQ